MPARRGELTISTHNGDRVVEGHNVRDPAFCANAPHIDPNGVHEVWHHEPLRDFYMRTFEAARLDYNKRARGSRQIGDYLDKLATEAVAAEAENVEIRERNKAHKLANEPLEKLKVAKKPVYEMIIGVYPQNGLQLTDEQCREILWLHIMGDGTPEHPSWEERNPGLRIVGIYYHADEPDGSGPHVHVDYVPVAECNRGMAVQNSLEKALNASGYKSGKVMCADGKERLKTAQERWTDAERDALQAVCEGYGYDVLHPQRGTKSVHKSTAEMRMEARIKALEAAAAADREKVAQELQAAQEARQKAEDMLSMTQAEYEAGFRAFHVNKSKTVGDYLDNWEAAYKKQLRAEMEPPPEAAPAPAPAPAPSRRNSGRVDISALAERKRAVDAAKAAKAAGADGPSKRPVIRTKAKAEQEKRDAIQRDAAGLVGNLDGGTPDKQRTV